tara:strand:- start:32 stop:1114 length:1083 start_codon:yes stop_codon:yes gene_type:complete
MKNNFWKNKKVFLTGHTGFKGSWLTLILNSLGAKVYGYALNPIYQPNFFDGSGLKKFLKKDFRENILNLKKLKNTISKVKPDIVFHLAAQSSVLVSYRDPVGTIKTNTIGTINLLEAARSNKSIKCMIIVTTDKVYQNLEKKIKFKENSPLGGQDIYSASKASCEILTESYLKSFYLLKGVKCNIATARSGNCIGGGDWTKDRIVKDCAEAFLENKNLFIRIPNASRPWQHVMEPLFGYLKLAEKLYYDNKRKYIGSWNFGPNIKNNLKVLEVAKYGRTILKSKSKILKTKQIFYESQHLSLDSSKAFKFLKWRTILNAKQALKLSFEWHKFYNDKSLRYKIVNFTINQIKNYKKTINYS